MTPNSTEMVLTENLNFRRMPCIVGKEPENGCKLEQMGCITKHTPEQGCMCGFVYVVALVKNHIIGVNMNS